MKYFEHFNEVQCIFQYKGKVYNFTSLGKTPLDIELALAGIDEGRIPAIPDYDLEVTK